MKNNMVITIGRQYGSGGREIGMELAKRFDIPFYDKEIIAMAAQDTKICEEVMERIEEQAPNLWLHAPYSIYTMPMTDQIFLAQSKIIKELAIKGPCVIVGRCADYILRDRDNCLNIFIHANLEERVNRKMKILTDLTEKQVRDLITEVDKKRKKYCQYYTDQPWGRADNYHIALNSGRFGIEKSVNLLVDYIELMPSK